ncbi:MAG TPA: right-handed parallel beta-helix repeat-containing protein, partial [Firmicutes bacterium]|nr:right-handed parallel beta-helix repeat-containing protein [Bacillota bacterium]
TSNLGRSICATLEYTDGGARLRKYFGQPKTPGTLTDGHWARYLTANKKAVCTIGSTTSGYTIADCDYLCDGTADQTEIQAAINSSQEYGEIVFLPGTYVLSQGITVNKPHLTLRGTGSVTLQYTAASGTALELGVSKNFCVLDNLNITKQTQSTVTGTGIDMRADYCTVKNCTISQFERGINIGNTGQLTITHNVIHDCKNGIYVDVAWQSNFSYNYLHTLSSYGIYVNGTYSSLQIVGNRIITTPSPLYLWGVQDTVISNNHLSAKWGITLTMPNGVNVVINANIMQVSGTGTGSVGALDINGSGHIITNNILYGNSMVNTDGSSMVYTNNLEINT